MFLFIICVLLDAHDYSGWNFVCWNHLLTGFGRQKKERKVWKKAVSVMCLLYFYVLFFSGVLCLVMCVVL